jgi:hypothetical protein
MFKVMAVAGLGLSLLAPSAAGAVVSEDKEINIVLVSAMGSGCREGTVATAAAPDDTAFTLTYSDYIAQAGLGAKATDLRKNCQLVVNFKLPQGFSFAVAKVDYRGYAHLEAGATGMHQASYYFQGETHTQKRTHWFGESYVYDDNWQATDQTPFVELVWSPCGADRYLNVNTELRVNAGSSDREATTSFMSMDSTDGSVSTIYHLQWRRC